jgi:RNAse (barnase) inhibitor barstar
MTAFKSDEFNEEKLDFKILRDGGIALYWRTQYFQEDVGWLRSTGYNVIEFECADWDSVDKMHDSLSTIPTFPSYYGRNLDALNECMCEDLEIAEEGGLCLALKHYDTFSKGPGAPVNSKQGTAEIVLDILARACRCQMLIGRRLITLVQSDDPKVRFVGLDSVDAAWNRREWFDRDRDL